MFLTDGGQPHKKPDVLVYEVEDGKKCILIKDQKRIFNSKKQEEGKE